MESKNSEDRNERVIETASATTSSDNSNSGPFAYVITAVALGVSLLFAGLLCSLVSIALTAAASELSSGPANGGFSIPNNNQFDNLQNMDDFDIEEFLREYGNLNNNINTNGGSGNSSSTTHDKGTASVEDALDFDIAPYAEGVGAGVSASSYAGTPNEVRDFVLEVISVDDEYSEELQGVLYDATLDEKQRAAKIDEALATCKEAVEKINELEVPTVNKDDGDSVKNALDTAKAEVARRWELLADEVKIFKSGDNIDTKKLWEADDKVVASTENAGSLFTNALEAASEL